MSHVRHSRQSGPRLRYTPKQEPPPPPVEPRNSVPIIRPVICGSVASVAEYIKLAPPELKEMLAEEILHIPRQRRGFLANANPERDEQGDPERESV